MENLRTTLRINGGFSAICGSYLTIASDTMTRSLGLTDAVWVLAFGLGLLIFALTLFVTARLGTLTKTQVNTIALLDLCYVLGAFIYGGMMHQRMDIWGLTFLIVTGTVVLLLAHRQWRLGQGL